MAPKQVTRSPDHDGRVVGLYAVLARDWSDFIDMCREEETPVLEDLAKVLRLPNPEFSADTVELNELGAKIVEGILQRRR